MMRSDLSRVEQVWSDLAPLLYVAHNEQEYEALVELLDALIDRVGEDETHPLASLMEVVGSLLERYEDEHVPELAETHD
jgi:HTH-type transcriptional regulator / antitoxin HigA